MITDKKTKTGAEVIIDTLKSLGTDTIFGYPGGVVLDLYDELSKQNEIKHILVRHEQAAVHSAEGYARVSGKCGVVIVTSGPGATNTVTGIANAYLDGYPLLVIAGQVEKKLLDKNSFQEVNICDITKSCTKKSFQITNPNEIEKVIIEAHNIAMSGKKGPVVVDIVKDALCAEIETENYIEEKIEQNNYTFNDIKQVISVICNSQRPVVVCGGGVTHAKAEDELLKFSQIFNIPIVSTMMGLGAYPQNIDNYFGMIGIFGDNCANEILRQADLIISLGSRFNDRIACMFEQEELDNKIIQIDINQSEIGRIYSPLISITGDIKNVLNDILKNCDSNINFSEWKENAQQYRNLNKPNKKTTNLRHTFEIINELEKYTKNKDIVFTTEVGQHQLWAVKNLSFNNKNRKILVSGGSGTMGFGLPSAIGACIANPSVPVVCIAGDGSLQMSLGELAVCKDYNLNLKILIINNGYLGMVRQLQEKNYEARYTQTHISNPDFVQLAKSFGIAACKVPSSGSIIEALEKAFENNAPYIIDFEVEPMEVI